MILELVPCNGCSGSYLLVDIPHRVAGYCSTLCFKSRPEVVTDNALSGAKEIVRQMPLEEA